jgi:hypothetical protein
MNYGPLSLQLRPSLRGHWYIALSLPYISNPFQKMNPSATIKLFLPLGDPKKVRTAELSNWSGKAVAAPRTDLEHLLARPELAKPGIYLLLGADPETGDPVAYVGEAEVVGDRLRQHKGKEFWTSAIAFVSKDENLTKAHIRYLEGRILSKAAAIGRYKLINSVASGAKLPESDQHEMEVFLERIAQLLPVLGAELLTPIASLAKLTLTFPLFFAFQRPRVMQPHPLPAEH